MPLLTVQARLLDMNARLWMTTAHVLVLLLTRFGSAQAPVTFNAEAPSGAFSDSKIAGEWQHITDCWTTECASTCCE